MTANRALPALCTASVLALAACGGSGTPKRVTTPKVASTVTVADAQLAAAEHPVAGDFPSPAGKSLQQLAGLARSSLQFGAATETYTPGTRRVAFALLNAANHYVYAPSAVYIASSPSARAQGPFPAPSDPLGVARAYQSDENDGPGGLRAIYESRVPFGHPGVYDVLVLTRTASGTAGATDQVKVARSSPIPDVGQRAPAIRTDTLASEHGRLSLVTTRVPPESMHSVSFDQVLGRRPIALLISTPALCTSRVCGPVTDIIVSLQHLFPQVAFIHQEVYAHNDPSLGLRIQLKELHLQSEPWLFTVDSRGVIRARLEGAFGVNEARRALEAALR